MDATLVAFIGVLVAAGAGVGGALLGARIAATATRQAAELAQAEARADRDEARRARFADRIRELAAELIDVGNRLVASAAHQVSARHANPTGRPPVVAFDPVRLAVLAQELRFLARLPETLQAIDAYAQATLGLAGFVVSSSVSGPYLVSVPNEAEDQEFEAAKTVIFQASARLEMAIGLELGTRERPAE